MAKIKYIHGYTEEEQNRLIEQGSILSDFVFDRLDFSATQRLLEVGSGVGAQTALLLQKYPQLYITGIEIEALQIQKAETFLSSLPYAKERYQFIKGNARDKNLNISKNYEAALFIWVLEHIAEPMAVLNNIQNFVIQGGKIFAVEVFHSSLHLYPHCPTIMEFWQKGIEYQASIRGDANIGQRIGNLFYDAGLKNIQVSPYPMQFGKYDRKRREKMLKYWHGLMKSAVPNMIKAGYIKKELWLEAEKEILHLQQNDNSVFYYSFVTIEAIVP